MFLACICCVKLEIHLVVKMGNGWANKMFWKKSNRGKCIIYNMISKLNLAHAHTCNVINFTIFKSLLASVSYTVNGMA